MMTGFWLSYTIIIDYKLQLKRLVIVPRNFWGEMIKVHIHVHVGHWELVGTVLETTVPPYDVL